MHLNYEEAFNSDVYVHGCTKFMLQNVLMHKITLNINQSV